MDYLQVTYFVSVWFVAALAGISRCVRNGDYKSVAHLVAVASVSGFLGLGVVALVAKDYDSTDFNGVFFIGIAAIIGLGGKEQLQMIEMLWKFILGKFSNG